MFSENADFFSWVQHLGLLGPLLRCSEADTVVVVFRNALPFNASVHIDGLFQKHDDASSAAKMVREADDMVVILMGSSESEIERGQALACPAP